MRVHWTQNAIEHLVDIYLHNTRVIKRFHELEQFDADDQETVIKALDAMVMKNKIQGTMSPLDSHPE